MAYLLARHPDWQERLRARALQLPEGELDWDAVRGMDELEWAWKETLRLMPVVGTAPRRPLRDTMIAGYPIAAGTFVWAAVGVVGRHPKYWRDPLRFDPARFSPERAEDKATPGIFLPFGAGAHACVGLQLASLETKLLMHALLRRCRFELRKTYRGRHTMTPIGMVSGPVELRLIRHGRQ